jgi:hypothetical protein
MNDKSREATGISEKGTELQDIGFGVSHRPSFDYLKTL